MANEIATHGVDVIIIGNNDLASFSGWSQHDPRYQDAIIKVHDAALKYGKCYGNAGDQNTSTGYTVSADTRMVQNGPACDGWRPAGAAVVAAPPGRRRSRSLAFRPGKPQPPRPCQRPRWRPTARIVGPGWQRPQIQ